MPDAHNKIVMDATESPRPEKKPKKYYSGKKKQRKIPSDYRSREQRNNLYGI